MKFLQLIYENINTCLGEQARKYFTIKYNKLNFLAFDMYP